MKKIFLILILFSAIVTKAQQAENIIIITTDGFRWQEAFKGMDETLARDKMTAAISIKNTGLKTLMNVEKN
jgi:hypothetical protein